MATVTLCDRCRKQISSSNTYKLRFTLPLSTELMCKRDICSDCVLAILKYIDPYADVESLISLIPKELR